MKPRGAVQLRLCSGCGCDVLTVWKPPAMALCERCGGKSPKKRTRKGVKRER